MRLLFNIILLLFITLSASAQKKEIAAAKDNIKKNRNLEQAEQSMKKLLEDSLNRSNLRIWNTMYDAIYKQYLHSGCLFLDYRCNAETMDRSNGRRIGF